MRRHDNNHRVLVLRLETDPRGVKRYVKAQKTLPELEQQKEKAEGGALFDKLVEKVKKRKRP